MKKVSGECHIYYEGTVASLETLSVEKNVWL